MGVQEYISKQEKEFNLFLVYFDNNVYIIAKNPEFAHFSGSSTAVHALAIKLLSYCESFKTEEFNPISSDEPKKIISAIISEDRYNQYYTECFLPSAAKIRYEMVKDAIEKSTKIL